MKIDYTPFYPLLQDTPLHEWHKWLPGSIASNLSYDRHGLLPQWEEALESLPSLQTTSVELESEVRVEGYPAPELPVLLQAFHPWRKGPYYIHGTHIDAEWRSDWKWKRLHPHIQPLQDNLVLDIGSGNGYHAWRMAGAGARLVIGIDPLPIFICQFFAMRHFIQNDRVWLLPLGIGNLPIAVNAFDTVFSMGVLYHRKSPINHLLHLHGLLRQGGELVLETLVVNGSEGFTLIPKGRYAKMRNVWLIPSVPTLETWTRRSGFNHVHTVDVSLTTIKEQRATDWMTFESLPDFLDPRDPQRTIEGYPAPKRAILIAGKP